MLSNVIYFHVFSLCAQYFIPGSALPCAFKHQSSVVKTHCGSVNKAGLYQQNKTSRYQGHSRVFLVNVTFSIIILHYPFSENSNKENIVLQWLKKLERYQSTGCMVISRSESTGLSHGKGMCPYIRNKGDHPSEGNQQSISSQKEIGKVLVVLLKQHN